MSTYDSCTNLSKFSLKLLTLSRNHALPKGLQLTWNMGIQKLVCYSDSLHAIELIQKPEHQFHTYAAIIQNTKDLLKNKGEVSLIHNLREGNRAADFMEKLGANQDSHWFTLVDPPTELLETLEKDAEGFHYLRL